jgi:hypothetical protein
MLFEHEIKAEWAFLIGNFIVTMNEIDGLTFQLHQILTGSPSSKNWKRQGLKTRLKFICSWIDENVDLFEDHHGREYLNRLGRCLNEVILLCDSRNLIAHGQFVLIPSEEDVKQGKKTYIMVSMADDKVIRLIDLKTITSRITELSDEFSECLAFMPKK